MTTTWDVLNSKLSHFLGDELKAGGDNCKFKLPLRIEAWNWAQREFAQHTAREMVVSPLGLEPDKRSALLPDDFMQAAQVFDVNNSLILVPMHFEPGGYRDIASDTPSFWVWGNALRFEASVVSKLELYYYAYWPDIVYRVDANNQPVYRTDSGLEMVQEQILIPKWAELPLLHLTTATLFQPGAIESGRNRENATRMDSGKPTDNARALQAREHLWWYHELLGQHTAQTRIGGVGA